MSIKRNSFATLLQVYLALMALMLVALVTSYLPLGPFQLAVSLVVATLKLGLIVLVFMELRYSSRMTRLIAGVGVFWFGILLVLSLTDYLSRGWTPMPSHWPQPPQGPVIGAP